MFQLGSAPLRRLTREQYNNTVRDLLGDDSRPADAFPADDITIGFAVPGAVSPLAAQHYMDAAESLAAGAADMLPCEPSDACAHEFIEDFATRAFRREVGPAELDRLEALFADANDQFGYDAAIETVVEFVLQSPQFLYRVELGVDSGDEIAPLTAYETASRLSYLLWNTMPDDALLDAAAGDELRTTEQLEDQARRLLDDPRADDAIASFHRQWLGLEGLDAESRNDPLWDEALAAAMVQETERFAREVILDGDGSLETLLTANFGFVNADLAEVYGVSGVQGDELVRRDFPDGERSGLLTQAALMARLAKVDQTDPVHRGVFVRTRLLCQELPAPPNDADIDPPDPDPDSTTRERFDEHSSNPACAGCHELIDPVGFGFEHYDPVGAYRTQDAGMPVDASGELVQTQDIDGTFDGALELGQRLAGSEEVRECVATQWFRFAFGRTESEADSCTQTQVFDAFAAADYDVKELLVGLVVSDGFRFKKVEG